MAATKVKHCGVTRLEDAELCAEAGAWAVGLIFWPGSPRVCPSGEAERIAAALHRRVELCGVFLDAPLDDVARTADALDLTMIQLHGHEGPAYGTEVARRTGAKVVKAARVRTRADVQALEVYRDIAFHLLDAHVPGRPGGTGQTFQWELATTRRSGVDLVLSGGLRAANVGGAIAQVAPFAVDVASGTEAAPGVKDPDQVAAFMAEVRAADGTEVAPEGAAVGAEVGP